MQDFLPVTKKEMKQRGWEQVDFAYITGDAYVDHPSFGTAIISRLLESRGYKVGIIPQPDWKKKESIQVFGEPRLGFLVSAGNMDSMVNHYTVSKKHRQKDAYSPGGEMGHRPDRAVIVYANKVREAFGDIPIIIPRNYLNLYNYGFAKSQGLPQISEGIFRRVSLGIDIAGNGLTEHFRGRIVGLSNRLNTILVPDAFIRWSNGRFGQGGEKQASRVIVETDRPVDAAVSEYLARKGYEAEGDRRDDGKATRFLRLAAGGVAGVGMAFSAMSFYVLMLSIFLLLQKNSGKMENLLLLGYAPSRVARPYQLLTLGLNLGVLCVALLAVWLVRLCYLPSLAALQEDYRPAGLGLTVLCGVALALLLSLFNGAAIRRKINSLNRVRR